MQLLHTSIRVKNMDESIEFYTKWLGMTLQSRSEVQHDIAEVAFLARAGTNHTIELVWRKDMKDFPQGDQQDHIAFGVASLYQILETLRAGGVEIAREPFLSPGSRQVAFIKDPNGKWIELIEQ